MFWYLRYPPIREQQGTLPLSAQCRSPGALARSSPAWTSTTGQVAAGPRARCSLRCRRRGRDADAVGSGDRVRAPLDARDCHLDPDRPVQLTIQIGARDDGLVTVGPTSFLEEAILWDTDEEETRLQVGIREQRAVRLEHLGHQYAYVMRALYDPERARLEPGEVEQVSQ